VIVVAFDGRLRHSLVFQSLAVLCRRLVCVCGVSYSSPHLGAAQNAELAAFFSLFFRVALAAFRVGAEERRVRLRELLVRKEDPSAGSEDMAIVLPHEELAQDDTPRWVARRLSERFRGGWPPARFAPIVDVRDVRGSPLE
jgi:hypothetical protein